MTTPAKSELDAARERLEDAYALGHEEVYCDEAAIEVRCEDLRLVLDALRDAELSRDNLLKAQSVLLEQIEIQSEMIEVLKERAQ